MLITQTFENDLKGKFLSGQALNLEDLAEDQKLIPKNFNSNNLDQNKFDKNLTVQSRKGKLSYDRDSDIQTAMHT